MSKGSKKILTISLCAVAALALGTAGIYAASTYGTASDPLITKSYVDSVLMPQIETIADSANSDEYTVLTMTANQVLNCKPGCEIMLRIGTASAKGKYSPVLVDTTSGSTLENSKALETNHLYMVTIDGNGIRADSPTTKVLIKGSYTIS